MSTDLGAIWDAHNPGDSGAAVIDTGASIQPDTRDRPGKEWSPAKEQPYKPDIRDKLGATVAKLGDKFFSPEYAESQALKDPPRPQGWDGGVAKSGDDLADSMARDEAWQSLSLETRRMAHKAGPLWQQRVSEMMALPGMTKEAAQILAGQELLSGSKKNDSDEPSEVMRWFAPEAKTVAEAEAALVKTAEPYHRFEQDYAQNGPAAFVRAAHARGHTSIVDAADPAVQAGIYAHFHGRTGNDYLQALGAIPAEHVQNVVDEARGHGWAEAMVDAWAHIRGVDEATRKAMAEVLVDEQFREFDGEHTIQILDRALAELRSNRKNPNATLRRRMDRTVRASSDQIGRRVA